MKQQKFTVLVGIPGSGKTTYATHRADENTVHVSSDYIRHEMGFEPGTGNDKVFQEMYKRTVQALEQGKSVIYDATNLLRKNRVSLLQSLKRFNCIKECIVFAEPFKVCTDRNCKRDSEHMVPVMAMCRMIQNFQTPMEYEGFDTVTIVQTSTVRNVWEFLDEAEGFKQDTEFHKNTLLEHMQRTADIIEKQYTGKDKARLCTAALYHDIGKMFTKTFVNKRGEETKNAHYYDHDNVGAYMFLTSETDTSMEDRRFIANLINWHMRPYMDMREDKRQAEREMVGEQLYSMIMALHEADVEAH